MDDVIWSCPDCDGDLERDSYGLWCPDCDGDLERDSYGLWCPACEMVVPYARFRDDDAGLGEDAR